MVSKDRDDIGKKDTNLEPKAEMDLRVENWPNRPLEGGLELEISESQDHIQNN